MMKENKFSHVIEAARRFASFDHEVVGQVYHEALEVLEKRNPDFYKSILNEEDDLQRGLLYAECCSVISDVAMIEGAFEIIQSPDEFEQFVKEFILMDPWSDRVLPFVRVIIDVYCNPETRTMIIQSMEA